MSGKKTTPASGPKITFQNSSRKAVTRIHAVDRG
jgi:hypothetical protein